MALEGVRTGQIMLFLDLAESSLLAGSFFGCVDSLLTCFAGGILDGEKSIGTPI